MSNAYMQVESGVPIPPARLGSGLYALIRTMNVGDSILFPAAVSRKVVKDFTDGGWELVTRKVDGGHRLWRTK